MPQTSTSPIPRTERLRRFIGAMQLCCAAALFAVSVLLFFHIRGLYSGSDAAELAHTLETYAQVVEIQKENYACIYSNIPSYHQLFLDSKENVESLENISDVLISISEIKWFKGLRNSARNLKKLSLQLKDSFSKTAETLGSYSQEKHETTLQAFDETIAALKKAAGKMRQQQVIAFTVPLLVFLLGALFAAGLALNGILCFLPAPAAEEKRS